MSDHISGPRAIADPVIDITDLYAFPCPDSPQHIVLIMNVFPYAGPPRFFPTRSFTGCGCVPRRLRPMDARLSLPQTNPSLTARLAGRKRARKSKSAAARRQLAT